MRDAAVPLLTLSEFLSMLTPFLNAASEKRLERPATPGTSGKPDFSLLGGIRRCLYMLPGMEVIQTP